jgi:uncharacterized protein YbjT (DUF2867 family)
MKQVAVKQTLQVVMIGATGAVGGALVHQLVQMPALKQLSLLVRKPVAGLQHSALAQHVVDPLNPESYQQLLAGHMIAVCTLGVGEPSRMPHDEFVRIDHDAVLAFAKACKAAGIRQFHLLASVDANAKSRSFYLKVKGQLCDALQALGFERLSIIAPSMILTPSNRYGFTQGLMLKIWPHLNPLLQGSWQRYRGIAVDTLGKAMANNLAVMKLGSERLHWPELIHLAALA